MKVPLISQMLQASLQLYRNAYTGIPKPIWWLSLIMFVNRSGTMVVPFLTVYLTTKGYSLKDAGFVMAAFGGGAILGSFLGGRLTDKLGSLKVQFFSLLLNGLFFILLGYVTDIRLFAFAAFLMASVGEAFRPANAAAIATFSTDDNRTRAYSLNRLAINLGWSIGPAVGGLLASVNYQLLFWADGLTCMAAAILLHTLLAKHYAAVQPVHAASSTTGLKPGNTVYKDLPFMQAMFFMLLIGICFFQLFNMVPVFYKEEVKLSEAIIGLILATNGILIVLIEMILVYRLENKRNNLVYMTWGTLLIALSFLLLSVLPILSFVVLSMLAVTLGEMLLFPFTNSFWVTRANAFNRGQYAAVYSMAFAIGQVLSPLLGSLVVEAFSFQVLFIIDFIICGVAALGFLWLRKNV